MPTVTRDIISTVTDATNIKLDISEMIDFLSAFDTPFLDLVGRDSLHTPCTQVKHEWLEDELDPRSGTLGAAYTAGAGQLTLASGQGNYLVPGDTVMVGAAAPLIFRVTSIATDVVTATLIGGTDANHANGVAWRKVLHAAQEGGVARADTQKVHIVKPFNYTQIIKDWIIVTGTMEVIDRYGYANERAYQEEKKLRSLALDLEQALLYSARSYEEGPPRISTMGGMAQYVLFPGITNSWSTVVNGSGNALTETQLNDVLEDMWSSGGNPDFVMVNGANKRRITLWATPRIRTQQGERTAGASIAVYESDWGELDIIANRHMRAADVVIGTRGQIGIGPLTNRQFTSRLLPATLDGNWYEILGEYTMEVHRPTIDFGWIYNTSTVIT